MKYSTLALFLLIGNIAFADIGKNDDFMDGTDIGTGGDVVAQEFIHIGQELNKLLQQTPTFLLSANEKKSFAEAVESVTVNSLDKLILDGVEVTAINYAKSKRIEVSISRWRDAFSKRNKRALALHEYLGTIFVDDTNYKVSNPLLAELLATEYKLNNTIIVKELSRALCTAIYLRSYDTVEQALALGANVDLTCPQPMEIQYPGCYTTHDNPGLNPIGIAIQQLGKPNKCLAVTIPIDPEADTQMLNIMKLILSYNPDLSLKYVNGKTALSNAIQGDKYTAAALLLQKGDSYDRALEFVTNIESWKGKNSPVPFWFHKLLVDGGANVNAYFKVSNVAYTRASVIVANSRFDVLDYYLKAKVVNWCLLTGDPDALGLPTEMLSVDHWVPSKYKAYAESLGAVCK